MRSVSKKNGRDDTARRRLRPRSLLRDLAVGRKGVVAVVIAVALIPLLLAAGGAIDFARLYMARERLRNAIDASLLAAGSSPHETRAAIFQQYLDANYPISKFGPRSVTPPNFEDPNASEFTASGTVDVPTVFLNLIGLTELKAGATAKVVIRTTGVEVALVLDNSDSMRFDNKLDDLKAASLALVDVVSNGEANPPEVKFSVVPFVTAVNIGTGNGGLVQDPTPPHDYPDIVDTSWKGCVEARNYPDDVEDNPGLWPPYFWQAEAYEKQCRNRWWRPDGGIGPGPSARPTGHSVDNTDNPFSSFPGSFTDGAGNPLPDTTPDALGETIGPNRGCPTPLLPLTNVMADVTDTINNMSFWAGGGTHVNIGAVWGWRALSPDPPFTEGVPYDDPDVNKVMIILTDGDHELLFPGAICQFYYPARYSSQYTSYGYLSENRLGTSIFNAVGELGNRFAEVCTNIKAAGITIYTIGLGLGAGPGDDAIREDLRSCASDPVNNFFDAPTGAQLETAFRAIGAKLVNLRVAK